MNEEDYFYDWLEGDDGDDEIEDEFECPAPEGPGFWMRCPLAGTEECDWDCPYAGERLAALSAGASDD